MVPGIKSRRKKTEGKFLLAGGEGKGVIKGHKNPSDFVIYGGALLTMSTIGIYRIGVLGEEAGNVFSLDIHTIWQNYIKIHTGEKLLVRS